MRLYKLKFWKGNNPPGPNTFVSPAAGSYKAFVVSTFTTVLLSFGCGIEVVEEVTEEEGWEGTFCSIEFVDVVIRLVF